MRERDSEIKKDRKIGRDSKKKKQEGKGGSLWLIFKKTALMWGKSQTCEQPFCFPAQYSSWKPHTHRTQHAICPSGRDVKSVLCLSKND